MNTHAGKAAENKSKAVANNFPKKQGSESAFHFIDNRPETIAQRKMQAMINSTRQNVLQRVKMRAGENELEAEENLQKDCDMIYGMLKSQVMLVKTVKANLYGNFDNPEWHNFLAMHFPNTYGLKSAEIQNAIIDGLRFRESDENIRPVALSQAPDIKNEFSALKACVITALMYSQGGSVLGASSVEGLHHILLKRFPDSYGQYSDEAIIPLLYKMFGYQNVPVAGQRVIDAIAAYNQGMVSNGHHMIGFMKQMDGTYNLSDNESIEATAALHKKRDDQATEIWYK